MKFMLALSLFSLFGTLPAQILSTAETHFLDKNIYKVVDSIDGQFQWSELGKDIQGKQIVMIGEFTHGSKEVNLARNNLVAYLHKNFGFNTVLFEGGMGEVGERELNKDSLSPQQLTYGFYGNGRVESKAKLMQYLKDNAMEFAGFDVQSSGNTFNALLTEVSENKNLPVHQYENLEVDFSKAEQMLGAKDSAYDTVQPLVDKLISSYKTIKGLLNASRTEQWKLKLVDRTIENRIAYLKYRLAFLRSKDWNIRWEARDAMMASNVEWLLKERFKGKKVIVLGHNFHISKHNLKSNVMGEFLAKEFPSKIYTLGLYSEKGEFADNFGKPESLSLADQESPDIKHIISLKPWAVSFLKIPKKQDTNTTWFFKPVITKDTFIDIFGSEKIWIAKSYDGLLLLKHSTPVVSFK